MDRGVDRSAEYDNSPHEVYPLMRSTGGNLHIIAFAACDDNPAYVDRYNTIITLVCRTFKGRKRIYFNHVHRLVFLRLLKEE